MRRSSGDRGQSGRRGDDDDFAHFEGSDDDTLAGGGDVLRVSMADLADEAMGVEALEQAGDLGPGQVGEVSAQANPKNLAEARVCLSRYLGVV